MVLRLADELTKRNLTLCGTIRQNEPYNPEEFLFKAYKQLFSSMFAFRVNYTLVSQVPKKEESCNSSENSDKVATEQHQYKPDIILHYNSTKGAVDTMDKMVNKYSVKRTTRRWPLVIFLNLLDITVWNSFVVWRNKTNNTCISNGFRRNILL